MATEYIITADNNPQKFSDVSFIGAAKTYSFDFRPWAEDNHDVSSASWETTTGDAAISGQALSGNIATALITTTNSGKSVIKLTATTSAEKYVVFLSIAAKDMDEPASDYGFC